MHYVRIELPGTRQYVAAGHAGRQLHNLYVAEVDFGAFGFQAQVALLLRAAADAVDDFAVDCEFDDTVHAHDIVGVPFVPSLAAIFDRLAPRTARIVGNGFNAANSKELAVDVGQRRCLAIAPVEVDTLQLEQLDLNAVRQASLY